MGKHPYNHFIIYKPTNTTIMKRAFSFAIILMAVFAFCACSGNTPTQTVEQAIECLQKRDYDGFAELVYMNEDEGVDVESQRKMISGMVGSMASEAFDSKGGIKSYDVTSEEIANDGETATVTATVTYGNGTVKKNDVSKLRKSKDGQWMLDMGK